MKPDTAESAGPLDSEQPEESGSLMRTSLLLQLRAQDPEAWRRLVHLYGPVVFQWCRKAGLPTEDATDVGQEVFLAVALGIKQFRREQSGDTFRGWLCAITRNKIRDYWRRRAEQPVAAGGTEQQLRFAALAAEESSDVIVSQAAVNDRGLFARALQLVQADFEDRTWQAFWQVTIEEQSAADVATKLGMSVGAVYVAKSRVLHRLRMELEGLEQLDG